MEPPLLEARYFAGFCTRRVLPATLYGLGRPCYKGMLRLPHLPHELHNMVLRLSSDLPHWFRLHVVLDLDTEPPTEVDFIAPSRFEEVTESAATSLIMQLLKEICVNTANRVSVTIDKTDAGSGEHTGYQFTLRLGGDPQRWQASWFEGRTRKTQDLQWTDRNNDFLSRDMEALTQRRGRFFLRYLRDLVDGPGIALSVYPSSPLLPGYPETQEEVIVHGSLFTERKRDDVQPPINTAVAPSSVLQEAPTRRSRRRSRQSSRRSSRRSSGRTRRSRSRRVAAA